MYELWHKASKNVVDFYDNAISAERHIKEIASTYGESALAEYGLAFEGDDESEDFGVEGDQILEAVRHLADAERAGKLPVHAKVG